MTSRWISGGILVAAGLALAGCGDPDAALIEQGQQQVLERLRDPGSAQFRNLRIGSLRSEEGSVIRSVCGEVNSRNGFGGYVGFQPFATVIERRQSPAHQDRSVGGGNYTPWGEGVTVVASPDDCGTMADIAFHCEADGVTSDEQIIMSTANLASGSAECAQEMHATMAHLR